MSLVIKPISGMLTKDMDFFGKMDPYCVCCIGNERKRTKTHSGGGKKPQWTDTLVFNTKDNIMRVSVYDDDLGKDDLVGEATVNLTQLYNNPNRTENQYVDLVRNGKSSGRVLISMEYQGQSNNQGWGNQGNMQSNWGNQGNQGPNQGWGNQGPNQGWGNQPPNNGWGNQNQGWGNQGNQGWGNQGNQGPNQGWGNQGPNQGPNPGWGNQPQNSGWGNQPQNSGWGNQPQNSGWGNQPQNSGWGNNQPQNSGWGNQGSQWGQNQPLTFIIKPIEANLLKDLDTFSKMDPFCAIDIGGNKQRTKTCQGGGKKPKFHDTLTFTSNSPIMNVAIFDEDVTTNELAGQATYNLSNAANNIGISQNQWIDLHANGKSAGRVLISIMAQQGNGNNGW